MTVEVARYPDQAIQEYRPTFNCPSHGINKEHAAIFEIVGAIDGQLRPEDALKLYEMAYFADGPVLEIGCFNGKSTTILALAIQAAGRGVPLHCIDLNPKHCEIAAANVKRFAPEVTARFYTGESADILPTLELEPAFVFIDGDHSYEGVKSDLQNLVDKLRDGGFLLLHDFFDKRNEDPNKPAYGVNRAAQDVLDSSRFAFCGRFGCTALYQKIVAMPVGGVAEPPLKTYELNTLDALGSAVALPTNEAMRDAIVTALVNHLRLPDYGIDWTNGRFIIPEIWVLQPHRRFAYFANLAVFDFACRYAEGNRVLHVGAGLGYGDHYLAARGAREIWSLEPDARAHQYARDRYKHNRIRFVQGTVEALLDKRPEPFDVVLCSAHRQERNDEPSFLNAIYSLLAPSGRFLHVVRPTIATWESRIATTSIPVARWRQILEPFFSSPQFYYQIALQEESDTRSQFEFQFQEGQCDHVRVNESLSGLFLCRRSALVPSPTHFTDSKPINASSAGTAEVTSPGTQAPDPLCDVKSSASRFEIALASPSPAKAPRSDDRPGGTASRCGRSHRLTVPERSGLPPLDAPVAVRAVTGYTPLEQKGATMSTLERRRAEVAKHLDWSIASGLEIGPLDAPVVTNDHGNIKYLDCVSYNELVRRHSKRRNADKFVALDYVVSSDSDFRVIDEKFDYVIACHVIEHVPDMIGWLNRVKELLHDSGWLFLAVPDKRYTFDILRPETTLSHILNDHFRSVRSPELEHVFEHIFFKRDVSAREMWEGTCHEKLARPRYSIQEAFDLAARMVRDDGYVDVHCHVFTSQSFRDILSGAIDLGLTALRIDSYQEATFPYNEFLITLKSS